MHRRTKLLTTLVVALFLALPLASAEWKGRGWYEPDTAYDQDSGFMWPDAAQSTDPNVNRVYFNVWADQDDQSVNPNSAILGSAIMPYPTRVFGMLGIWRDCNGDGFIGQPEGLFQWYPAQLLLRQDICPADPQPYGRPGQTVELVHNDGVWVREFIQIGNERPSPDATGNDDPYAFAITDNSSKMWGDWNLPEEAGINTCPVSPLPRGTWQSTGGTLRYVDCHAAWRGTSTISLLAETTGQHQLSFSDAPRRPDQSESDLNQPNPWGQEGDESAAYAFDCSRAPISHRDTTGLSHQHVSFDDPRDNSSELDRNAWVNASDENYDINVSYHPGTPRPNPSGSPAGTVNESWESIGTPRGSYNIPGVANGGTGIGNCNRSDDSGGLTGGDIYPTLLESDHEGVQGPRSKTDFYFDYRDSSSGSGNGCTLQTQAITCTPLVPQITGEGNQAGYIFSLTGGWFGNPSYTASRNPYVNRETLQPWGASYATYYAYVDDAVGELAAGTVEGTYGSHHCIGTTPRFNPTSWECDPANWWIEADGESSYDEDGNGFDFRAVPGEPYNLLDVDCWDAAPARGVEGPVSTIGERQCDRIAPHD